MAKYNYDKSKLKGLTPFPFLGEVKTRTKHIEAADTTLPKSVYNPNILAAKLHPHVQFTKIAKVIDHGDAKSFVFVPDESKGTKSLAYFRAGQYVSLALDMDGVTANKPYSLCSSPKDALGDENTSYTLTVKHGKGAQGGEYILSHFDVGTEVLMSGPLGNFYYQDLRDAGHVVALAGGSGITPFLSMVYAIRDGMEDFDLTILYGSRTKESILFRDELNAIAGVCPRVKVVHVLSKEVCEGFEHGFLTADLIRKYAPAGEYSVFLCGPEAMYRFALPEVEKLELPRRRVRCEAMGVTKAVWEQEDYPADCRDRVFRVTVRQGASEQTVQASANEPVLVALERAGIVAPSRCRSGECGWCRSKLVSGQVYVPAENEGRRRADMDHGYIHPCCTFALSDLTIEVPGEYLGSGTNKSLFKEQSCTGLVKGSSASTG